jgi:small subunit ribosomal protein S6
MGNYQLTILIKNDLEEKARKELLDSITKSFGKTTKEDIWGSRSLAYPINHAEKAFYAHFEFEAEPGVIPSLDKNIKLKEDIIRYLIIRKG